MKLANEGDYLRSAVLVPIIKTQQGCEILFEVRSSKLKWQPGEICFPGGRIEDDDESIIRTAVRETCEELNISQQNIQIIGVMDVLVAPIGVIIYPCIGYIKNYQEIKPSCDEVAEVFTVPLEYLRTAVPRVAKLEMATRPLNDFPFELLPEYQTDWKVRTNYEVYFYTYNNYVIWGLTARVLNMFLKHNKLFLEG